MYFKKETSTQRKRRLAKARMKRQEKLARETEEEKEIRKAKARQRRAQQLANETPERREVRLEKLRFRMAQLYSKRKAEKAALIFETEEEKEIRTAKARQRRALILANETPKRREVRLEKLRFRRAQLYLKQKAEKADLIFNYNFISKPTNASTENEASLINSSIDEYSPGGYGTNVLIKSVASSISVNDEPDSVEYGPNKMFIKSEAPIETGNYEYNNNPVDYGTKMFIKSEPSSDVADHRECNPVECKTNVFIKSEPSSDVADYGECNPVEYRTNVFIKSEPSSDVVDYGGDPIGGGTNVFIKTEASTDTSNYEDDPVRYDNNVPVESDASSSISSNDEDDSIEFGTDALVESDDSSVTINGEDEDPVEYEFNVYQAKHLTNRLSVLNHATRPRDRPYRTSNADVKIKTELPKVELTIPIHDYCHQSKGRGGGKLKLSSNKRNVEIRRFNAMISSAGNVHLNPLSAILDLSPDMSDSIQGRQQPNQKLTDAGSSSATTRAGGGLTLVTPRVVKKNKSKTSKKSYEYLRGEEAKITWVDVKYRTCDTEELNALACSASRKKGTEKSDEFNMTEMEYFERLVPAYSRLSGGNADKTNSNKAARGRSAKRPKRTTTAAQAQRLNSVLSSPLEMQSVPSRLELNDSSFLKVSPSYDNNLFTSIVGETGVETNSSGYSTFATSTVDSTGSTTTIDDARSSTGDSSSLAEFDEKKLKARVVVPLEDCMKQFNMQVNGVTQGQGPGCSWNRPEDDLVETGDVDRPASCGQPVSVPKTRGDEIDGIRDCLAEQLLSESALEISHLRSVLEMKGLNNISEDDLKKVLKEYLLLQERRIVDI